MPDPADYHARWKKNASLAETVAASLPDGRDWEIVFRFYSALHLVEGFMRTKPFKYWSESHEERGKKLRQEVETKRAAVPYRELLDMSMQVRYDPTFAARAEDFAKAKACAVTLDTFFKDKLERALTRPPAAPSTPPAAPSSTPPKT